MIANQTKGTCFRGLLKYLWYGSSKKPRDAEDVRLIGGNMVGRDPQELINEFEAWVQLRPDVKRTVYHVSLSIHPDEHLTDGQWRTVAEWYMSEMGFEDTSWMIVRHMDEMHEHVHAVASRIRWDGTVVSDRYDYRRSAQIVQRIEREYQMKRGAHTPEEAWNKSVRSPSKKEFHKTIKDRKPRTKMLLQQSILAAAADRPTMTEFLRRLAANGITAKPNQAKTGRITGISFMYKGIAIKGSDLGKAFSWQGLQRRLHIHYDAARDWKTLKSPPRPPPTLNSKPKDRDRTPGMTVPVPKALLKPFARKPQARSDVGSSLTSHIAALNKALFSIQTQPPKKKEEEDREIQRGFR